MNIPDRMKVVQKKTPMKVGSMGKKPTTYLRVGNSLIRDTNSTLYQTNRFIHSQNLKRSFSQEIKSTNYRDNSSKLKMAHVAEKTKDVEINNRLHSRYSGIEQPRVDIASITKTLEK